MTHRRQRCTGSPHWTRRTPLRGPWGLGHPRSFLGALEVDLLTAITQIHYCEPYAASAAFAGEAQVRYGKCGKSRCEHIGSENVSSSVIVGLLKGWLQQLYQDGHVIGSCIASAAGL